MRRDPPETNPLGVRSASSGFTTQASSIPVSVVARGAVGYSTSGCKVAYVLR